LHLFSFTSRCRWSCMFALCMLPSVLFYRIDSRCGHVYYFIYRPLAATYTSCLNSSKTSSVMYFYIFVWRTQNYLNDQVKISSYVPPRLLLPHSKTSTKSCDDGDTMQGFKKNANWSRRRERNISWWCKSLLPTLTKNHVNDLPSLPWGTDQNLSLKSPLFPRVRTTCLHQRGLAMAWSWTRILST
jgi:hypothetical protein